MGEGGRLNPVSWFGREGAGAGAATPWLTSPGAAGKSCPAVAGGAISGFRITAPGMCAATSASRRQPDPRRQTAPKTQSTSDGGDRRDQNIPLRRAYQCGGETKCEQHDQEGRQPQLAVENSHGDRFADVQKLARKKRRKGARDVHVGTVRLIIRQVTTAAFKPTPANEESHQ